MNVKKVIFRIIIVSLTLILFHWFFSVTYAKYLTDSHGSEFKDIKALQYDHLHAWDEGDFQIRILSYSNDRAVVYYYSEYGGEKIEFCKKNNVWQYYRTLAIWSKQGSADDYFIWPYYKNIVP